VRALAKEAKRGDSSAVEKVVAALTDESADVREAAARALADLADVGNTEVLDAVAKLLQDASADVRCASLEALSALAGDDVSRIAEAISGKACATAEKELAVRVAALRALQKVANTTQAVDDSSRAAAVQAAAQCASDGEPSVAKAALETLTVVAPPGSEDAVEAARKIFDCKVPLLRAAALTAFAAVAAPGDADAIKEVTVRLEKDEDSDVRAAALHAVAKIADEGDEQIIAVIARYLEDGRIAVRKAALEALLHVSPRGHLGAGLHVVQGLKDAEAAVRKVAGEVLAGVASPGSPELFDAVGQLLCNGSKDVRTTAVAALSVLGEGPDDQRPLQQVCKHFNHRSKNVRAHMRAVAEQLGGQGSQYVVEACAEGLQDEWREDIRLDALRALKDLGPAGNRLALEKVAHAANEDESPKIRRGALEVLTVLGKKRKVSMLVAAHAMQEHDPEVAQQGFRTMMKVAPTGSVYGLECLIEMLPLPHFEFEDRAERRVIILEAIGHVGVNTNHEGAIEALIERINDLTPSVRLAALDALQRVAKPGNEVVIEAVADMLDNTETETRNLAVERFKFFAEPGDQKAASAAIKRTRSSRYENRAAALHALAGVLDPGRCEATPALSDAGTSSPSCSKLDVVYWANRLRLSYRSCQAVAHPLVDGEVMSRLLELAVEDEYQPVKTAAMVILHHVETREPLPEGSLASTVYAPLGDASRFTKSGVLSLQEKPPEEGYRPCDRWRM